MSTFTTDHEHFLLDGQPFRILSGAMHYFRIHPSYWRDRLEKLKAMGLNTLETYVAWNLHEARPGQFDFGGWLDLAAYIRLAGEVGLKVIVRPGPYICSEWEFGGLPSWLLKDPAMRVRCLYPPYLAAVDRFFDQLLA
jgi:beta-galactosidase